VLKITKNKFKQRYVVKYYKRGRLKSLTLKFLKDSYFDSLYKEKYVIKTCWKKRIIKIPNKSLSILHKFLLNSYLEEYWDKKIEAKIKEVSFGFLKWKSVIDAIEPHINKNFLIKIDLTSYFDSFWRRSLFNFFLNKMWLCSCVAKFFSKLCTFNGRLPQGISTSPMLSSILSVKLDSDIIDYIEELKKDSGYYFSYTRYADDIFLSSNVDNFFIVKKVSSKIFSIIKKNNFSVNYDKFEITERHKKQKILWVIVNSKPSLWKKNFKRIKAIVFNINKNWWDYEFNKWKNLWNNSADLKTFQKKIYWYIGHFKMINLEWYWDKLVLD